MSSNSLPRLLVGFVAASLVVVHVVPARAAEEWKECAHKGEIVVERAPVDGSKFYDYRARTRVALPAAQVIARIWAGVTGDYPPSVSKREVLSKTDDDMLVYDRIKTPVVSDRDVTNKLHKTYNASTGAYGIEFHSANELGPPPQKGFVRIPLVRGAWSIVPDGANASIVTYQCYSEPGGAVPAFLVRGTLQDETTRELERVLQHISGGKR